MISIIVVGVVDGAAMPSSTGATFANVSVSIALAVLETIHWFIEEYNFPVIIEMAKDGIAMTESLGSLPWSSRNFSEKFLCLECHRKSQP